MLKESKLDVQLTKNPKPLANCTLVSLGHSPSWESSSSSLSSPFAFMWIFSGFIFTSSFTCSFTSLESALGLMASSNFTADSFDRLASVPSSTGSSLDSSSVDTALPSRSSTPCTCTSSTPCTCTSSTPCTSCTSSTPTSVSSGCTSCTSFTTFTSCFPGCTSCSSGCTSTSTECRDSLGEGAPKTGEDTWGSLLSSPTSSH